MRWCDLSNCDIFKNINTNYYYVSISSRQHIFCDDISLSYSGWRLQKAEDSAAECGFSGATYFLDGASASVHRTYNLQKIFSVTPYSIHGAATSNAVFLPNPWLTDMVSYCGPFEYSGGVLSRGNFPGGYVSGGVAYHHLHAH